LASSKKMFYCVHQRYKQRVPRRLGRCSAGSEVLKGEGEIAVIVKEKVIRNVAQPGIEERGEHNRGAYARNDSASECPKPEPAGWNHGS
jgi:hypothetical protein